MTNTEKKRRLGANMKPREAQTQDEDTVAVSEDVQESSTDTVQEDSLKQVNEQAETGVETPRRVEGSETPKSGVADQLEALRQQSGGNRELAMILTGPEKEFSVAHGAKIAGLSELGLQPDGSYRVVVTLEEGYWEPVQQWAAADGLTPEEWLSRQLIGYLETWGQPAQNR